MDAPMSSDDPFAVFLQPPPNETPGERAARIDRELAEKVVSDSIDSQIEEERVRMRKRGLAVARVLLLGQAESGKGDMLKDFRMRFAKEAWDAERALWCAVIQLNVVRSVITIIDALQAEMDGYSTGSIDIPNTPLIPITPGMDIPRRPMLSVTVPPSAHPSNANFPTLTSKKLSSTSLSTVLTAKHQLLKMRLSPLRRLSHDLKMRLGEGASELEQGLDGTAIFGESDSAAGNPYVHRPGPLNFEATLRTLSGMANRTRSRQFGVRWVQEALAHGGGERGEASQPTSEINEAAEVLAGCLEDMKALWADEVVREVLKKRRIQLEERARFFLDNIDRIARRDYSPSDDDIVRARGRALGVQEYRIQIDRSPRAGTSGDTGREWLLYDVGWPRTMRHAWFPFFDNLQAIIFFASVSCFDERLSEDSKSTLENSFLLWQSVCSSRLLGNANMILLLSKCNVLERKLKAGLQVKMYLPSYGTRANEVGAVVKYLREKFKEVLKIHSPRPRPIYNYVTSVIDTETTAIIINAVEDSIKRDNLQKCNLI